MRSAASSFVICSLFMHYPRLALCRHAPFVAAGRLAATRSAVDPQLDYLQDTKCMEQNNGKFSKRNRKKRNEKKQPLEQSSDAYHSYGLSSQTSGEEPSSVSPSRKAARPAHKNTPIIGDKEIDITSRDARHSSSNRLIQIPMSMTLQHESGTYAAVPIKTFIDTGAQTTVMTFEAAKRAGIAHLIDRRYAGHASGVAGVSCRVLGRIPANSVTFIMGKGKDIVDTSPSIAILEDQILDGQIVDMLLGLDVLEEWQAMICLRDRELTVRNARRKVKGREIVIPFVDINNENIVPPKEPSSKNNAGFSRSKYESNRKSADASSQHDSDLKARYQLYGQRSNPFTRDTTLLKSELDALDERTKSRPYLHEHRHQLNTFCNVQDIENSIVEDEDDTDSYYFESDEDYDDCDLSGV